MFDTIEIYIARKWDEIWLLICGLFSLLLISLNLAVVATLKNHHHESLPWPWTKTTTTTSQTFMTNHRTLLLILLAHHHRDWLIWVLGWSWRHLESIKFISNASGARGGNSLLFLLLFDSKVDENQLLAALQQINRACEWARSTHSEWPIACFLSL